MLRGLDFLFLHPNQCWVFLLERMLSAGSKYPLTLSFSTYIINLRMDGSSIFWENYAENPIV